jgi:hypothetical protein
MTMQRPVEAVAACFAVPGELAAVEPFAGGHIHDSYRLTYRQGGSSPHYLLQRLNDRVFCDPAGLMENIRRVTAHIAQRLAARGETDVGRKVLTLVLTQGGAPFYRDDSGVCWRLYVFVEGTRVYETVETPAQAEQAGRAFGEFQSLLADLAPPRLRETIPDFHNTPLRYAALDRVVAADVCGRVAAANAEIEFAARRRGAAAVLLDLHRAGEIPERIVHNDAKIANVLVDAETGEALCVVDLDTVMPGLSLYDFGDMVRTMTSPSVEDETDLSRVEVQVSLFEALARGYLSAAGGFLNEVERAQLVTAGKLITLEQGVRFLTDFLGGDTYYKTQRPGQNLDRCRTQFKLVASLERYEDVLTRLVARPDRART